jgi:hypothetical protein
MYTNLYYPFTKLLLLFAFYPFCSYLFFVTADLAAGSLSRRPILEYSERGILQGSLRRVETHP